MATLTDERKQLRAPRNELGAARKELGAARKVAKGRTEYSVRLEQNIPFASKLFPFVRQS